MSRLAGLALALYPLAFRRRYGEELHSLVYEQPVTMRSLIDLLRGALLAHLNPPPGLAEELEPQLRLRLALGGVLACWAAFAAAGVGFYKTTENHPFGARALLGDTHLSVQLLAVLASVAVLAGALPLVVAALRQAERERGRLRRLLAAPLLAVLVFALLTALLALGAHSREPAGTGPRDALALGWALGGVACTAVCVLAARRALLAIDPPLAWLRAALGCAMLVTGAMVAIALAVTLYAIALFAATPGLADAANGPFAVPATGLSLALQALWMALFSLLALLSVRRGRRALA